MESSPIPASSSSLDFYSGTAFLLIPTRYCRLDGVLFDYEQKDMPLDVPINCFLVLEGIILTITYWRGIVKTFEVIVC